MKLIYQGPQKYKKKVAIIIGSLSKGVDPVVYVDTLCNLKGPSRIILVHKPIKFAAQFQKPNKILLGLRNDIDYISLSLAHEYAHLLLLFNKWQDKCSIKTIIKKHKNYQTFVLKNNFEHSIEQSLAILIQVSYEDKVQISHFSQKRIKKLMQYMDVWEIGQYFLKAWKKYQVTKYPYHSYNFHNIFIFIKSVINQISKQKLETKNKHL